VIVARYAFSSLTLAQSTLSFAALGFILCLHK